MKNIFHSFFQQQEVDNRKRVEERRRDTLRLIEQEHRQSAALAANRLMASADASVDPLDAVNTDDEADDAEYEAWKLRELRRLKRDKVHAYYSVFVLDSSAEYFRLLDTSLTSLITLSWYTVTTHCFPLCVSRRSVRQLKKRGKRWIS